MTMLYIRSVLFQARSELGYCYHDQCVIPQEVAGTGGSGMGFEGV